MTDYIDSLEFAGFKMTTLLRLLLGAGPLLSQLVLSPVHGSDNATLPLVMWHGMGKHLDA